MYPLHTRLHPVLLRVDPLAPLQPAAQGLHRYRIRTYAEEVAQTPTRSIRRNYGRVVYGGQQTTRWPLRGRIGWSRIRRRAWTWKRSVGEGKRREYSCGGPDERSRCAMVWGWRGVGGCIWACSPRAWRRAVCSGDGENGGVRLFRTLSLV